MTLEHANSLYQLLVLHLVVACWLLGVGMCVLAVAYPFRHRLKRAIYAAFPSAQTWWIRLNALLGHPPCHFEGWGMTTTTHNPWAFPEDAADRPAFLRAQQDLIRRVEAGVFVLSQSTGMVNAKAFLDQHLYRHYYVWWTVRYAVQRTSSRTLVECGVGDGLSAYFAASGDGRACEVYLYDAFGPMQAADLLRSEQHCAGWYGSLRMARTAENLRGFAGRIRWRRGAIPGSLAHDPLPDDVAWLHIDLNAARPTMEALEAFWPRLAPGGVVLFDDYGWTGWVDTRRAVDAFVARTEGAHLLALPTGQAICFKARAREMGRAA